MANADARLRPNWLTDPAMLELTDTAWRVFTNSLIWCNLHGLDGNIDRRHLNYLHPYGVQPETIQELIRLGLWRATELGYTIPDWTGTMGQSLGSDVDGQRELAKARQQAKRDREKAKAIPATVTRDVPRDVPRDVGQARDRTETGQASDRLIISDHSENAESVEDWPVAELGKLAS